ncbi:MAG TPA: site-specific integrase [Polyangia bacterium]|nr:site-specific integrase [Polyangia bacterium]
MKRREAPIPRTNPSGKKVWVARYTNLEGKRKSAGTHPRKGPCGIDTPGPNPRCCAQHMIDAAYEAQEPSAATGKTLGEYAETWLEDHPRIQRTADSHRTRLNAALKMPVEGRPLAAWPYRDLKRRQIDKAVDHMLRVEKRAVKGAIGIRNTLSAMTEDAILDEVAEVNFAKGFKIRANDPRVRKAPKKIAIWSFDQLKEFAHAGRADIRRVTAKPNLDKKTGETLYYPAVDYEAMLLTIALCNFRIGEVFALLRTEMRLDLALFLPTGSAYEGVITRGDTEEKRHEGEVPIPPTAMGPLAALPPRIDSPLLFPTRKGTVWHYSTFIRDVWRQAEIASELPIKPHECRHSYVTHMRAEKVDPADLAAVTRHGLETATRHYTKPLGRSMQQIRDIIG